MSASVAAQYSDALSDNPDIRAGHSRLQTLKVKLHRDPDLGPRVHHYAAAWEGGRVTGLQAWGRQVLEDIWSELEEETSAFASQRAPSWEDHERDSLNEFVERHARDFVGRADMRRRLIDHARSATQEGASWGICVVGAPGTGKSALFAQLHRELQPDADVLLLAHAAAISPRSSTVDSMLRRWITELAEALQVREPLPVDASTEHVETAFASLLARASAERRVVLLIDALNQFEPTLSARYLTWLPRPLPENARLIATAMQGVESQSLASRRGGSTELLQPLTRADSYEIAVAVGRRYHREFHPRVLETVLSKSLGEGYAAGNPLWLHLALEELNLLDANDFARAHQQFTGSAEQRLHQMVLEVANELPANIDGLYDWMLRRTEHVFSERWAKAMANVIALGRFGWREQDLRVLVPAVALLLFPSRCLDNWDDLNLAELRRGFRAQLMKRGSAEQWDFIHAQLRQTIEHRNLADAGLVQSIHSAIVDHLESLPSDDQARQSELMFHMIGADDRTRAARYYGGSLTAGEKAGATQALVATIMAGETHDPNPGLQWVASLPEMRLATDHLIANAPIEQPAAQSVADRARQLCRRICIDILGTLGSDPDIRLRILDRLIPMAAALGSPANDPTAAVDMCIAYTAKGDALAQLLRFSEAIEVYRVAIPFADRIEGSVEDLGDGLPFPEGRLVAGWIVVRMANAARSVGDATLATTLVRKAVEHLAPWIKGTAVSDNSLTTLIRRMVDRHQLRVAMELLDIGTRHTDPSRRLEWYRELEQRYRRLIERDPEDLSLRHDWGLSMSRVAAAAKALGDSNHALEVLVEAESIFRDVFTASPNRLTRRNLATAIAGIGDLLAQGYATSAVFHYRREASLLTEAEADLDPQSLEELASCYGKMARALTLMGQTEQIVQTYAHAFEIWTRLRELKVELSLVGEHNRLTTYEDAGTFLTSLAFNNNWTPEIGRLLRETEEVMLEQIGNDFGPFGKMLKKMQSEMNADLFRSLGIEPGSG